MTDAVSFIGVLGEQIDLTRTDINILYDIYNTNYINDDLINILASYFNYNNSYIGDSDFHRDNLKTIVELYQTKGSKPSFDDLMTSLGYTAKIIPLWTADDPQTAEIAVKV
jgi:hypothetical protein